MANPDLSAEEDKLLRFAVMQTALHSKGVHKTQFDRQVRGESYSLLHKLEERGFLRRTGNMEYVPTVHGQLYLPEFPDVRVGLQAVLDFGRSLLDSSNPNKIAQIDQLVRVVYEKRMIPLHDAGTRFWFECSLFGLEPYIHAMLNEKGGAQAVLFGPDLLGIETLDELLAKIEARHAAAVADAAVLRPVRARKRKGRPKQIVNIHAQTIGAVQTGEKSTANVTQTVGFDTAAALKLIEVIRAAVPSERQDVRTALEQVTVEVESDAPDHSRVRTNVGRLWRLATDVSTIAPFVMQLARMLGVHLPGTP